MPESHNTWRAEPVASHTDESSGQSKLSLSGPDALCQSLDQSPHPGQALLAPAAERAQKYIHNAKAAATVRAYRADWRHFEIWCLGRRLVPLPAAPETVALYLAEFGGVLKPATLQRRLAAIAKAHQAVGNESPASMRHAAVSEVWKGLRRTHGTAQRAKAPILTSELRAMLRHLPGGILGVRDMFGTITKLVRARGTVSSVDLSIRLVYLDGIELGDLAAWR